MHIRHGCRCNMPTFPMRGKAKNARDCSFAWTACNLWNSLPRCVRDISGEEVRVFKKKLDKILAFYPDKLRSVRSGKTLDRHGRRSNSLYDYYRNKAAREELDKNNNYLMATQRCGLCEVASLRNP